MSSKRHWAFPVWALLITLNIIVCVSGQYNNNLDKPFVLRDGQQYRDKLTMATAKAVAQFAHNYENRQGPVVSTLP